jgi:hypothetical protein
MQLAFVQSLPHVVELELRCESSTDIPYTSLACAEAGILPSMRELILFNTNYCSPDRGEVSDMLPTLFKHRRSLRHLEFFFGRPGEPSMWHVLSPLAQAQAERAHEGAASPYWGLQLLMRLDGKADYQPLNEHTIEALRGVNGPGRWKVRRVAPPLP